MSGADLAALNGALADRILQGLARGGVAHVVASPGSRSTPLVLAALRQPGVSVHRCVDERVAGFLALGLARGAGRPVALICTSGSAGAHYLPALVEARQSRIPLIALTADRPETLHGLGAPQTVPQQGYFGPHAGFFRHIEAPAPGVDLRWVGPLVARAVDAASGVSHLNVAFREPLWSPEAAATPSAPDIKAPEVWRDPGLPSPALVARLAARLVSGGPGVIVAGPMEGADAEYAEAVSALAAALGWPVIADPASGLRYRDGANEPVITTADAWLRPPLDEALAALRPAQALRLGRVTTSKFIDRWLAESGAEITLVDAHGDWHDPQAAAARLVVASPTALCQTLCQELRLGLCQVIREAVGDQRADEGWIQRWRQVEIAARAALADACAGPDLWEAAVARITLGAVAPGGVLHAASSMPIRDLDAFGAPEAAQGALDLWSSRGANGIDGTFATALGEALGARRPVTLLIGDVATLHDAAGLIAARELRGPVNLTAVVVDNGGGGIFDFLPIAGSDPEAYHHMFRTDMEVPLAPLCEAAGARLRRPETAAALEAALAEASAAPGVDVIAVRVPSDGSNVARHRAAFAAARAAAVNALEQIS